MKDSYLVEMVSDFIGDVSEMLDDIEPRLIDFEQNFQETGQLDKVLLDGLFRAFHTIKGGAGFLGLGALSDLTHETETLLDMLRSKVLCLEPRYTILFCESVDMVRCVLAELQNGEKSGPCQQRVIELTNKYKDLFGQPIKNENDLTVPVNEQVDSVADSAAESVFLPTEQKPKAIYLDLNDSPEMLDNFYRENLELLDSAEQELLKLDENEDENDLESLSAMYRHIHSVKGNCGIFAFSKLEKLAHLLETLVDRLRGHKVYNDVPNRQLLLIAIDILRGNLSKAVYEKDTELVDVVNFTARLELTIQGLENKLFQGDSPTENSSSFLFTAPHKSKVLLVDDERQILEFVQDLIERAGFEVLYANSAVQALEILQTENDNISIVITDIKMPGMTGVELTRQIRTLYGNRPVMAISAYAQKEECLALANLGIDGIIEKPFSFSVLLQMMSSILQKKQEKRESPKSVRQIEKKETIRVDLEKLDHLVNLVGELVIAESMVTHHPDLASLDLDNFDKASNHLNKIVRELQDVAMNIRMIPVSGLFKRMIRLVHDLANSIGKQARLELVGEETEIDKTVIEMISDPLVHIIRNALDHGLENPTERQEKGKSASGLVRLEARYEGGEVWILISDDGRGLSRKKILRKALDKGLIKEDELNNLGESQVYNLIFVPGFSTAEHVTDVSGRGVGMDVVKKNIEKLNGRIAVHSVPEKGTTVILHIPLTLAIIEGMIVRVGESIYTIPLLSIRESARVVPAQITKTVSGTEVVRIRQELIPVVRLYETLGTESDTQDLTAGILVIVEEAGRCLAFFVDEIVEQHQAVVKGLSSYIGDIKSIMGCTILGDGRISLILDVSGLIGANYEKN